MNLADVDDDDRPCFVCQVDELGRGDQFFSPAHRWETVTGVDAPRYVMTRRVFTDVTGPEYAWQLANSRQVPVLRAWLCQGTPVVRVEHTRHYVTAFVGTAQQRSFSVHSPRLAAARWLGAGQGWEVTDRPGGGDMVTSQVPSKTAALAAVRRAARTHAKALRLPLHRPEVPR